MPLSEFSIIEHYFTRRHRRADVVLGVGDDAALLAVPPGMQLAVCVDALVAGRHFPLETSPEAVGHKALAVNLSDLAAMGAEPAWATLALTLPEADERFLAGFAAGFYRLAERYGIELVGGDTVRGPLQIVVQLQGLVPAGAALTRAGARPGDRLFVTGTLGDAGAGLALVQGALACDEPHGATLRRRLDYPEPRVAAGRSLCGIASAAIDVSDGLLADLGHILDASGVGAELALDTLPFSAALKSCVGDDAQRLRLALTSGDDYELCFTVPREKLSRLDSVAVEWDVPLTCIGEIREGAGIGFRQGELPAGIVGGFDHFGKGNERG